LRTRAAAGAGQACQRQKHAAVREELRLARRR
jgi:hypothetical protein